MSTHTPETDQLAYWIETPMFEHRSEVVSAYFARTLEEQRDALKARVAELEAKLAAYERPVEDNKIYHFLTNIVDHGGGLPNPEAKLLARAYRQQAVKLKEVESFKNSAYSERNKLVAFVSKIFPASLERHVGENWDDDWRWVVFIDTPTGQASWHIHDSELLLFAHLPKEQGRKWDGHSTEEKYSRLAQFECAEEVKNLSCTAVIETDGDTEYIRPGDRVLILRAKPSEQ